MKQLTVYDLLFCILFYLKFTHRQPSLSWLEVFTPYILQAGIILVVALWAMFGLTERIKYILWLPFLRLKVRRAGNKARAYMKAQEEKGRRSANPGQYRDPQNYGK